MAEALITPANVTIQTVKSDIEPFTVTLTDTDTGSPINVTGYTARLQVRYYPSDGLAVTLTSSDALTVGTTDGLITIDPTTVNALGVGTYKYDLQVTRPNSTKRTIIGGNWVVQYEATTG